MDTGSLGVRTSVFVLYVGFGSYMSVSVFGLVFESHVLAFSGSDSTIEFDLDILVSDVDIMICALLIFGLWFWCLVFKFFLFD